MTGKRSDIDRNKSALSKVRNPINGDYKTQSKSAKSNYISSYVDKKSKDTTSINKLNKLQNKGEKKWGKMSEEKQMSYRTKSPSDPTFDYSQKSTTLNKKYKPEYQDDFAMKRAAKGFGAGVIGLIGKAIDQGKKRGYI